MTPNHRKRNLLGLVLLLLQALVSADNTSTLRGEFQKQETRRVLKGRSSKGRARARDRRGRGEARTRNRSIHGGGQGRAFGGGRPARCIVRGEPVVVASVQRRGPNVQAYARVDRDGERESLRVGGRDGARSGERVGRRDGGGGRQLKSINRSLQYHYQVERDPTRGRNREVNWPNVESEEDCFYGVFAIRGDRPRPRPPRTDEPTLMPTVSLPPSNQPSVGESTIPDPPTAAPVPTVSIAPSLAPSVSNAPSMSSMPSAAGGVPDLEAAQLLSRNIPFTAVTRKVDVTLDFGFFFEAPVTVPTKEQLLGLLEEITYFYEDTILYDSMYAETYNEININLIRSDFDADQIATTEAQSTFPVSLVLEFDVSFFENTGGVVPTGDQLVMVFEVADYGMFIEDYVWNAKPFGELFYDVQIVQFTGTAA